MLTDITPLGLLLNLEYLNLSDNNIKQVQDLKPLSKIKHLKCLYLQSFDGAKNPVCDVEDYRKKVLSALPHLKRLDGVPRDVEKNILLEKP
jgi:Leucine-rich repeat (LRR) protein